MQTAAPPVRERTANAAATQVSARRRSSSARSPAYAVALAAADSAPDLRVRIRAELKSMTFSVTKLRADDAAACSTSSQYLTKRISLLLEYAPTPEAGRCGNLAAPVLEKSAKLGVFGIPCLLAFRSMNHC